MLLTRKRKLGYDARMKEETYGYFPGGSYDPRKFVPDREVNTPEEIAAWEKACAERNAGVATIAQGPCLVVGDGFAAFSDGSTFGYGTYEIDIDDDPPPGAEEDIPRASCA